MTVSTFIEELTMIFDKPLKLQQVGIYQDKLRRFSPEQLVELLNKVLEEVKTFPKVSEIYKAANELGFLAVDTTKTRTHHWEESSDCGMCHGEGRLCIYWEVFFEERDSGRVEIQQLKHVAQYSRSFDYKPSQNEFRSIFRCKCAAGDATTIPKSWPKWSRNTPTRREVWA